MKLSDFETLAEQEEEGATVTIHDRSGKEYMGKNDAGEAIPVVFTIVGAESKRVKAAKERVARRLLKSRRAKMEPADILANRIEQAASAVIGWEALRDDNGSPLPCSVENVSTLLKHEHILEQVEEAIEGHRDFFTK